MRRLRVINNESVALKTLIRRGEEVMTTRPDSLDITSRSPDQIYIVSCWCCVPLSPGEGGGVCLPEWPGHRAWN